jgi:hypothetical protein
MKDPVHIEPVDCRQETRDSMFWLPYIRPFADDDHPIFPPNANSSSDDDSGNLGAEVSGIEEESEDEEDESS